jgi:hypothetical protein
LNEILIVDAAICPRFAPIMFAAASPKKAGKHQCRQPLAYLTIVKYHEIL